MGIKVIVPPSAEPVSRVDCQRHLRLDHAYDSPPYTNLEDPMILAFLSAAREHAENFTELSIAPQTLELALDRFPSTLQWDTGRSWQARWGGIQLPRGPVQSIVSVSYTDPDGAPQTVDAANWVLDDYSDSAWWLIPAEGFSWPATGSGANAVKVRYVAGFSLPGDSPPGKPLPQSIRAALLLFLGHLYENREASTDLKLEEIPLGVCALLQPFRTSMGV